MQAKQQMLKAIEELPDDANIEDALERLYLLYKNRQRNQTGRRRRTDQPRRGSPAHGEMAEVRWTPRTLEATDRLAKFLESGRIVPEMNEPEFREIVFGNCCINRVKLKHVMPYIWSYHAPSQI